MLQTSTWLNQHEGLGNNIQILLCVYIYKDQNDAIHGIPWGYLGKWKLDFKEAG